MTSAVLGDDSERPLYLTVTNTADEGCGQSAKDADILHRGTTPQQRLQIRLFCTSYWEIPNLHRIQEIHVGNYLQLEIALSIFKLREFGSWKGRLLRIR